MKTKLGYLIILAIILGQSSFGQEVSVIKRSMWNEDLNYLVKLIKEKHPNPFDHVDAELFNKKIKEIQNVIPNASDKEIVIEFMKLIALLHDGHSGIMTNGANIIEFDEWFPFRFYKFMDGWHVIFLSQSSDDLIISKVIKVGNYYMDEVEEKLLPIVTADNYYGALDMMPFYLSNGVYLSALSIVDDPENIELIIEKDGKDESISFHTQKLDLDSDWLKNPLDLPFNNSKQNRSGRIQNLQSLQKLHKTNYWFNYDKEKKTIYFQLNSVCNNKEESLLCFTKKLFGYVGNHKENIENFIIDLRYNEGGNGHLLIPFIHEFIKHDNLFHDIDLYTIIGRRTFSAAVIAVAELKRHTNSVFVGEPMGAPLHFYSDGVYYRLPNSRLLVYLSSLYFQLSIPANKDSCFYPDIPIETSSADMVNGVDPQIDAIISELAEPLYEVCINQGINKAVELYQSRKKIFESYKWWKPESENEINNYGYALVDEEKYEEALKIFLMNTKLFPNSWNCWDSLGEQYLRMEDQLNAVKCYEKSFQLNKQNTRAKEIVEKIRLINFLSNIRILF